MDDVLHRYNQQAWNPQHTVAIHKNGVVSVDGIPVATEREQAIANILLRMNANNIALKIKVYRRDILLADIPKKVSALADVASLAASDMAKKVLDIDRKN